MKMIRIMFAVLVLSIGAFGQSLICIPMQVDGFVNTERGAGVSGATIVFIGRNGSPTIVLRSNQFGRFQTFSAISCEIYDVRIYHRKYIFDADDQVFVPAITQNIYFTAYD